MNLKFLVVWLKSHLKLNAFNCACFQMVKLSSALLHHLQLEVCSERNRENAKLKKENARLRGETNEKAPVAPNTSEAYITGVCGGAKYMISFDSEGFDQNPTSTLITCLSESIRDGRDFELTLKGGKKIDPKKTFSKNGILPNSFVYVRYTGPPLDD